MIFTPQNDIATNKKGFVFGFIRDGLILARFTLARPILARFTLARLVSALGGRIFTDSMRFNYPQDCFACIALCLSLHP